MAWRPNQYLIEVRLEQLKSVARLEFGLHKASMPSPKLQGSGRSSTTSLQSIPLIPSITAWKNSVLESFSGTTTWFDQSMLPGV